jgi:hypothetical protein
MDPQTRSRVWTILSILLPAPDAKYKWSFLIAIRRYRIEIVNSILNLLTVSSRLHFRYAMVCSVIGGSFAVIPYDQVLLKC